MESSLLARILYITCFFASAINAFLPIKLSHFAIECGRTPPRLFAGNFFDEIEGFPEESESGEVLSDEALEAAAGEWDPSIPQFNRITLTGRIGNDPDPRYFDDGKVVLNLSLAVKRKYDGYERRELNIKSGDEETDWFGLEIWGRDAEYAAKYVTKGCRVGVTGTLQVDFWEDKLTGESRQRVKIIVKDLDILETRAESELRKSGPRGGASLYQNNGDNYDSKDDDEGFGSGYGYGSESSSGPGGFFD